MLVVNLLVYNNIFINILIVQFTKMIDFVDLLVPNIF